MRRYAAAILFTACAVGPASALDVGVGTNVGGIGVGANAGVGTNGASVGANVGAQTDVGGAVGVDAGASAGAGNGSIGAGLGANTNIGGTTAGVSAGVDTGGGSTTGGGSAGSGNTAGGSTAGSPGSGGMTAATARSGQSPTGSDVDGTTNGVVPTEGAYAIVLPRTLVPYPIILPANLRPSHSGSERLERGATWGYPSSRLVPFVAKPGIPQAVLRVCQQSIVSAATPLGAVRVDTASAGSLRRQPRGVLVAPIEVRIQYQTRGGVEVRQARALCRLDAAGRVIALK
jgi:hypothetical protein